MSTRLSHRFALAVCVLSLGLSLVVGVAPAAAETFVRLHTDAGDITLVLEPEKAPNHVANFVHLCSTGFYDGSYFHRVIPGFMIQGGDPNTKDEDPSNDGMGGPTLMDVLDAEALEHLMALNRMLEERGFLGFAQANLMAEFNDTPHLRGVLSMARSQSPDSAGSQFFICHADATQLDNNYTVFGRTVLGLDIVDAIAAAPNRPGRENRPVTPVHIVSVEVIESVGRLDAAEVEAWQAMQAEAAGQE